MALALGAALSGPAFAEQVSTSRYTPLDLDRPGCRVESGPAEGANCAGLDGWSILIGFPAVGASVALVRRGAPPPQTGASPKDGRSLSIDGLSPSRSPAEWRGSLQAGRFTPLAAIMRLSVLDAGQRREMIESGHPPARPARTQVLVVFRLGREGACEVAYVDVQANPAANDLARGAADTTARTATCPVDRIEILGQRSAILDGYLK